MKALLLAGHQNSVDQPTALIPFKDQLWIDWQITQLHNMGYEVGLVIGDKHSERILAESEKVGACDFIFDTNGENTTLMSNLRSGVFSVSRICFVLPIGTPAPYKEVWQKLIDHYYRINAEKYDLLKSFCPVGKKMQAGYPFLVTRTGVQKFKHLKDINSLEDERLTFSPVPQLGKAILDQFPKQREL